MDNLREDDTLSYSRVAMAGRTFRFKIFKSVNRHLEPPNVSVPKARGVRFLWWGGSSLS